MIIPPELETSVSRAAGRQRVVAGEHLLELHRLTAEVAELEVLAPRSKPSRRRPRASRRAEAPLPTAPRTGYGAGDCSAKYQASAVTSNSADAGGAGLHLERRSLARR